MAEPGPVTDLLLAWARGDATAQSALMRVVYDDLRHMARRRLRGGRAGESLDATGLVHEAYLRLVTQRRVQWQNRAQFFGLAARMMRRVLVDHARRRAATKRGGAGTQVPLSESAIVIPAHMAEDADRIDVLALDAALTRLRDLAPRHSELVELRYFGGLSIAEAAHVLNVSPVTVKRDWALARAWLYRELRGDPHA
jgi:RNA polymerase sigma factor (TIGR02999 family)